MTWPPFALLTPSGGGGADLEAQAVDDALDLFTLLMATRLILPTRRASDKERFAVLPQLEKAARTPTRASKILVEELDRVAEHDADLERPRCGPRWRRPCRGRRCPARWRW
ncbi:hypothetical protein ACH4U6_15980 [Streptomyces netropsis]|uniref:hypothetical protein n=1 Tax=Streptomyces netropsis TaxID=55404 RepID=UPI0037B720B5